MSPGATCVILDASPWSFLFLPKSSSYCCKWRHRFGLGVSCLLRCSLGGPFLQYFKRGLESEHLRASGFSFENLVMHRRGFSC